jgi:hypothetical protein
VALHFFRRCALLARSPIIIRVGRGYTAFFNKTTGAMGQLFFRKTSCSSFVVHRIPGMYALGCKSPKGFINAKVLFIQRPMDYLFILFFSNGARCMSWACTEQIAFRMVRHRRSFFLLNALIVTHHSFSGTALLLFKRNIPLVVGVLPWHHNH